MTQEPFIVLAGEQDAGPDGPVEMVHPRGQSRPMERPQLAHEQAPCRPVRVIPLIRIHARQHPGLVHPIDLHPNQPRTRYQTRVAPLRMDLTPHQPVAPEAQTAADAITDPGIKALAPEGAVAG